MIQINKNDENTSHGRKGVYSLSPFFDNDWKLILSKDYSWITQEYWELCESLPPFGSEVTGKMMSALKKLMKYCPYHMDVVGHYASGLQQRGKTLEALAYVEMAIAEGERAIIAVPEFVAGQGFIYYGDLDNRPFLRAISGAVEYTKALGHSQRAAELCDRGLMLDPSDRVQLGLNRALLSLELHEYDRLFKLFSDGSYAELPHDEYNIQEYLLLAIGKFGDGEVQEAEQLFSEISRFALRTAEFLTTRSHETVENCSQIGGITSGSEFESFYYAQLFRHSMSRVPGATEWLETQVRKFR